MKKYLLIIAVLVLALTSGTTVFAQTETATENVINWSDISETVEAMGLEGDFYAISTIGLAMWIPQQLQDVELTDEDIEKGYLCYLSTEDESAAVAVMYYDIQEESLDNYIEFLKGEEDVKDVEAGTVNGIDCVSYMMPEADTMNISFVTDAGYLIEFTFWPMSDEGFATIASVMAASIQTVAE